MSNDWRIAIESAVQNARNAGAEWDEISDQIDDVFEEVRASEEGMVDTSISTA